MLPCIKFRLHSTEEYYCMRVIDVSPDCFIYKVRVSPARPSTVDALHRYLPPLSPASASSRAPTRANEDDEGSNETPR